MISATDLVKQQHLAGGMNQLLHRELFSLLFRMKKGEDADDEEDDETRNEEAEEEDKNDEEDDAVMAAVAELRTASSTPLSKKG